MVSPQSAWEFMKKLSNSPWAPVVRLIQDPDVLGCEPNLSLQEELEDCALVVEETDSPAQRKTSSLQFSSGEDSDEVAKYYPSPSDSDDSVVVCQDIEQSKPFHIGTIPQKRRGTSASRSRAYKPGPKSKKRVRSSPGSSSKAKPCPKVETNSSLSRVQTKGGNGTVGKSHDGNVQTKLIYNGQLLKLKPLKIVLIDIARMNEQYGLEHSQNPKRPGDKTDDPADSKNPRMKSESIEISDSDENIDVGIVEGPPKNVKKSSSPDLGNLKRPRENLSWGLDSIQELEKRRKLRDAVKGNNDEQEVLATPCIAEAAARPRPAKATSRSALKPPPSSCPDDIFGLNAGRLRLVMEELNRMLELAERLQKSHLKPDAQKEVAYKFKYSLSEVARLVSKKSLNNIVADRERLEKLKKEECQALNEKRCANTTGRASERSSKEMSPSEELEQISQLDKGGKYASTSKQLESTCADQPVVDVYVPRLVQGVAAGFLGIFDRLQRLESKCDIIEKSVTSKETPRSIDIGEVD